MFATTAPLPLIRPITDMRTSLNDVCDQATETGEPVILTKNGKPAYVLMDSDAFDAARLHQREVEALREMEIEEKYRPKAVSAEEVDAQMAEIFALWGVEYARA